MGLNFLIRRTIFSSYGTFAPEKAHGYSFPDKVFQAKNPFSSQWYNHKIVNWNTNKMFLTVINACYYKNTDMATTYLNYTGGKHIWVL
jgi:hypothetical protein